MQIDHKPQKAPSEVKIEVCSMVAYSSRIHLYNSIAYATLLCKGIFPQNRHKTKIFQPFGTGKEKQDKAKRNKKKQIKLNKNKYKNKNKSMLSLPLRGRDREGEKAKEKIITHIEERFFALFV